MKLFSNSAFSFVVPATAAGAIAALVVALPVGLPQARSHDSSGAAALAADRPLPASVAPARKRITGSVGPGFVIRVSTHRVRPGKFTIVVRDRSSSHNWHIRGPGVNKQTSVPFTGTRRFRVDLDRGRYRIVCDPHSSSMRTRLVVRRG